MAFSPEEVLKHYLIVRAHYFVDEETVEVLLGIKCCPGLSLDYWRGK